MNILVYMYDVEIKSDSTNSVGRLVAAVIGHLEKKHTVTFFSMDKNYSDENISTKPIFTEISFYQRLMQKLVNTFYTSKKIKAYHLKKQAFRNELLAQQNSYDYIIVPALDEVEFLRKQFPNACIIYWIHNISAFCKNEYIDFVNKADIFLSPSRTTYHLLIDKLQPRPLAAEFVFMPNWCADVFLQNDFQLMNELKKKHSISESEKVFIFSGSDIVLKGKFILEKAIKKLEKLTDQKLVFFFAGGQTNMQLNAVSNIRIIPLGVVQPKELAAYYHISHFGCIPSLAYDHCPLVLLEMIQCNVLPIASDIGGIKEITGADYPYLIPEPHEVNRWLVAMLEAISLDEEGKNILLKKLQQQLQGRYMKENAFSIIDNILIQ